MFEAFRNMYAAYFRELTEKDGLGYWKQFVDQCDPDILRDAIEHLAEVQAMRREAGQMAPAPRIQEVKRQYWGEKEKAREKQWDARFPGSVCAYCDNTGYVFVASDGVRILDPRHPVPIEPGTYGVYAAACICPVGTRVAHRKNLSGEAPDCDYHDRENNAANCFRDDDNGVGNRHARDFIRQCERLYAERERRIRKTA